MLLHTATVGGRRAGPAGDDLADAVVRALITEAELTPKPGLVDRRGGGAHQDMDCDRLITSAHALRASFRRLAEAGGTALPDAALRIELGRIGRDGEREMARATGGVNTHRGAIWALGLAIAALARPGPGKPADILGRVAAIAAHHDPGADATATKGRSVRARYGVAGAIGEARAGFPHALRALEALRRTRLRSGDETAAQLDALLHSIAGLEDTCLLGRGGPPGLALARGGAAAVLGAGGAATRAGRRALRQFDHDLVDRGLSPGGSADMLALALFLDRVTEPVDVIDEESRCSL